MKTTNHQHLATGEINGLKRQSKHQKKKNKNEENKQKYTL